MAVVPSVRTLFPMKAASGLENSRKEPLDILPRDPADWPDSLSDLRGGFADRLNVYRVMAHHPELLLAWKNFRNHVVGAKALGNEYCEVVILRTARRLGAVYEWAHHVEYQCSEHKDLRSAFMSAHGMSPTTQWSEGDA